MTVPVTAAMEFCLLGPLAVRSGGVPIPVSAGKQRAVLAALLLDAGRVVPVDELARALWGGAPPASARVTVQTYVMRLRKTLGPAGRDRIETRPGGYLISVDIAELDVTRFEALIRAARAAARDGSWDAAAARAREALVLWRGEPLADAGSEVLALREAPRLAELRLQALEARTEADLQLGYHAEVIAELGDLVAANPLRERLRALLMLALYRDGRQGEALAAYQQARRVLVAELGTEPGAGLRDLHQRMLAADPGLSVPEPDGPPGRGRRPGPGRAGVVVPRQLPAAVPHFAGRSAELAALTGLLHQAGERSPGAVVISAIGGTAGVGKTALAVRWAHQVADQFPDGQLYVNLRGFDPSGEPVGPADALRDFLTALQVPPERVPAELEARAGLYRSLLAGQRLLIVADNAADEQQVRPLLPGSSGCLVVVTSRWQLTGLVTADGACPLTLDVLSDPEARELLISRLGAARVAAEPAAAAELAALCARLPLSLSVTAARAAIRPGLRLAVLAAELRDARDRLDVLTTGDPATSVRAVLSWSYEKLDSRAARMFRLLGLHPGPDISISAAASLAGTSLGQAGELLGRLVRAHLLTEHAPARYASHDLLRGYAAGQARAVDTDRERRAALARLLDYCLAGAAAAADFLSPAAPGQSAGPAAPAHPALAMAAPAEARAWLDAELATVVAVAAHAAEGWPGHVIQLSESLSRYLDGAGRYPEAVAIHTLALEAADRSGDRRAQASALVRLAGVDFWLDRLEGAAGRLRAALARYDELGDRVGQSRLLNNLGLVAWRLDRYAEAAEHYRQALEMARTIGYQIGEANSLNNLGLVSSRLGRHQQAAECCLLALDITRETGNRLVEANVLDNLGHVMLGLGRHQQAAEYYRQVIGLAGEIGSRTPEADSLDGLGRVLRHQGHCDQAADHHERALAIYRAVGRRRGEAVALNGLGEALRAAGRPAQARARHDEALAVASQVGDRYQQARAYAGLAGTCADAGDPGAAARHWHRAYAGYADLGVPEADGIRARLEELALAGRRSDAAGH